MIAISTGGILVASCLLAAVIVPLWRKSGGGKVHAEAGGGRGWRPFIAPVLCLSLGIVCATAVGGLIGAVGRKASQGAGQLGNDGLKLLAGAQPQAAAHPAPTQLSAGAAIILLVGLVVFGLVIRKAPKQRRRDMGFCLIAGLALGPAAFALQLDHAVLLPALLSGGNLITGHM